LAVGDAEFQKKCLGKMGDVAKEGRTVLFVSHNMGAITQLCPNAILLNKGMLEVYSNAESVVKQYLSAGGDSPDVAFDHSVNLNAAALITRLWVGDNNGQPITVVDVNKSFTIGIEILGRRRIKGVEISIRVFNSLGHPLFTTNLSNLSGSELTLENSSERYLISVPSHFLAPDAYSISAAIHQPFIEIIDQHENAVSFETKETGSQMWRYKSSEYGNILVNFPWRKMIK
ncbi:MAG: Wzt carbohydrate-binding domain-containing protein, partial [Leadbetterella sp.]|nr:Wzt carbohydrate-binding domain-containing protein [Leadbetterella sp.]